MLKRIVFFGFIFLLFILKAAAQFPTFAYAVTLQGDTISGVINNSLQYEENISFKQADNKKIKVKLADISYMQSEYYTFERVTYVIRDKEKSELLRLREDGRIKLLIDYNFDPGTPLRITATTNKSLGRTKIKAYKRGSSISPSYVAVKAGKGFLVVKDNFEEVMTLLVTDSSSKKDLISTGRRGFVNIEQLVKEYNNDFGGNREL